MNRQDNFGPEEMGNERDRPEGRSERRLLAHLPGGQAAMDLGWHLGHFGPIPWRGQPRRSVGGPLIATVGQAGLKGRGGGAFPTATKMMAVACGRGRKVVVANGVEGEPDSFKDRLLLSRLPHLVVDGAVLAAEAVGAREVILAVHPDVVAIVDGAVQARREAGTDPMSVAVEASPVQFVAGEETALVQWLNGGPAKPTRVPPRPAQRGVAGRPTLVNNVETLAQVGMIARYGAPWFRERGTPDDPGTSLVSLSGAVNHPGVIEISRGATLAQVVESAGGLSQDVQAFLIGGYFGTWLSAERAWSVSLCQEGLRPVGASLGAGVVLALPTTTCGLSETARIVSYLADQSAGQCGPCVNGLGSISTEFDAIALSHASVGLERLERWMDQVEGRGACRHPDGAVHLLRSALRTFANERKQHLAGRCSVTAPDHRARASDPTTLGRRPSVV
ncbi:MAG: NADH-ubiquinone oxidoreductase-F iron-sulfur binding region domain-containing protein [Acidimicrobiales bacterium]